MQLWIRPAFGMMVQMFDLNPIPDELTGQFSRISLSDWEPILAPREWAKPADPNSSNDGRMKFVRTKLSEGPGFGNLPVHGPNSIRFKRNQFEIEGWTVCTDDIELKEISGRGFLYGGTGSIWKTDHSLFTKEEFQDLHGLLYWLFTLCASSRRGIYAWEGFDEFGSFVTGEFGPLKTDRPTGFSWCPSFVDLPAAITVPFVEKYRDPNWAPVIRHSLHWLSEANGLSCLDARILFCQITLEMLASAFERFDSLKLSKQATPRFTDLLNAAGIDPAIPETLEYLHTAARTNPKWSSGPAALVDYRNAIAHADFKKIQFIDSQNDMSRLQLCELGRSYVEQVLLWLFGYDLCIRDRTQGRKAVPSPRLCNSCSVSNN